MNSGFTHTLMKTWRSVVRLSTSHVCKCIKHTHGIGRKGFTQHSDFYKNLSAGFTLIEVIVAIFVFSIVLLLALGAILSMFNWYNNIQTTQRLFDAVNFSVDAMVRDVRFGTNYECGGCQGTGDPSNWIELVFDGTGTPQDIRYEKVGTTIVRTVDGFETQVTPDTVSIDVFDVYIAGDHPRATFVIEGTIQNRVEVTDFSLQTTVSQQSL